MSDETFKGCLELSDAEMTANNPEKADSSLRFSSRSWASVAKNHPAELITEALGFLWVISITEALGEFEKFLLLAFLGFDAVLDEFDQHTVGT